MGTDEPPTLDHELRRLLRQAISNRVRERVPYTGNGDGRGTNQRQGDWADRARKMAARGMSTYAIAAAIGVSSQAVQHQLRKSRSA